MLTARRSSLVHPSQRGLSVVEMMVGLTIGLIVVAAASQVVVTQLNENRKLLVEMQVQQDLRATADIITRELRRAGAWNAAENGVWLDGGTVQTNGFRQVSPETNGSEAAYRYKRDLGDSGGPYGFKLQDGSIRTRFGDAWQELTDGRSLKITSFTITQRSDPALTLPCAKLCDDGTTNCWPTIQSRVYEVSIAAEAVSDASVKRSIRSMVKLRNDLVGLNDTSATVKACPL
ncbi:PilW family protein [Roseateles toxinivorans]|uniref:Type IV pilus assembly protein PilW n=1 Tax=Roseateles toxinivorans TaxID=270368 RepID=A0A4R6QU52_9BURK|nr:prepilin-type N-terminal cleavage/methylation domain-containing protein [Roseateles toxinivorans]TDP74951.1 type IV pilus assembly protein PilW [Roseateles toxinivorans]